MSFLVNCADLAYVYCGAPVILRTPVFINSHCIAPLISYGFNSQQFSAEISKFCFIPHGSAMGKIHFFFSPINMPKEIPNNIDKYGLEVIGHVPDEQPINM
jgi:hypothetical protein